MIGSAKFATIFAGILTFLGAIGPTLITASPMPNPIHASRDDSHLIARDSLDKRAKIVGSDCVVI
ncbi:15844_t:CDS:2 [Funneliformis caledonium]|uniref:15844_t:CDS:1 n=1 Tax=Funneliformis caledonium TaxID=1117310 RepID=A0A9N9HA84_9GLOM|nr:15844_t:CDS:2 [Funneliformis caledonium]